jgi:hypothetical protein
LVLLVIHRQVVVIVISGVYFQIILFGITAAATILALCAVLL